MKKLIIIAACIALSGCAIGQKVENYTIGDASAASGLAATMGDTTAKACYDFIGKAVAAIPEQPADPGVLYLNELTRAGKTLGGQVMINCNGVLPLQQFLIAPISIP
jgi:hypothetical protein